MKRDLPLTIAAVVAAAGLGFSVAIDVNRRSAKDRDDREGRQHQCETLLALTTLAQDPRHQADLYSVTRGLTPNGVRRLPLCRDVLP